MKKAGFLKNAVAKETGFYSVKGEKLKGVKLSKEFCDEWNGVKKAAAKKSSKKVEEVVEEVLVQEEAPVAEQPTEE